MAWSQGGNYNRYPKRGGYWAYVPDPPAVPVAQIADGTRCSAEGRHTYTFGGGRLQQDKFRYYAACADGCFKCAHEYLSKSTDEFLQSVSNSELYTAIDFALYVLLEEGGHAGHLRVIDALKLAKVEPKWYVYEGNTWKKRM
jgi:hypothetical protein